MESSTNNGEFILNKDLSLIIKIATLDTFIRSHVPVPGWRMSCKTHLSYAIEHINDPVVSLV